MAPTAKRAKVAKGRAGPTMTAKEAEAAAEAEGLTLVRSKGLTGFKGVSNNGSAKNPFTAAPSIYGNAVYLGVFPTAEAAALAIARFHMVMEQMMNPGWTQNSTQMPFLSPWNMNMPNQGNPKSN